jgi:glutamate/tyrosine decarboxylase-like PLP-dependent enzyme
LNTLLFLQYYFFSAMKKEELVKKEELDKKIMEIKSPYFEKTCFSYPGTVLDKETLNFVSNELLWQQFNNIGMHTMNYNGGHKKSNEPKGESGFEKLQKKEASFIFKIGRLLDAKKSEINGYFGCGGTEGNFQGVWTGLEYLMRDGFIYIDHKVEDHVNEIFKNSFITTELREKEKWEKSPVKYNEIVIFLTKFAHYSFAKAIDILKIKNIVMVETNDKFEMSMDDLKKQIEEQSKKYKKFLIIATAGTIGCGSIDPIPEINSLIEDFIKKKKFNAKDFYFHVDACLGGFTIPIVQNKFKIGFSNQHLKSISLDAHKMGHMPYPAGIFICRQGIEQFTLTKVDYIKDNDCFTFSGSRSGFVPVYAWYFYRLKGMKYIHDYIDDCIKEKLKFVKEIEKINGIKIRYNSEMLNLFAMSFNSSEQYRNDLEKEFNLRSILVNDEKIYHIVIFKHHFKHMDGFLNKLKKIY